MYVFVCTGTPEHTSYSASREQIDSSCPTCGAPTLEVRGLDKHPLKVAEGGATKVNVVFANYDERSINWSSDPQINALFLRQVKNFLNDKLRARGFLFLNDVFNELGMPLTPDGQLLGWLWSSSDSQKGVTLWHGHFPEEKDGAILLEFNVDGIIYDKIEGES